jgi:hypothetical protein
MTDLALGRGTNMDEQDRQDGNYLVLVRDLSSTRGVAQNLPTIVDRKEKCTPILSILFIHVCLPADISLSIQ